MEPACLKATCILICSLSWALPPTPSSWGTRAVDQLGQLPEVRAGEWSPLKKIHNLKVENYVLFGGLPEDLSTGDSLSDTSERLLQRDKEGARIYRSFCNKTQVVGTSNNYC